MFTNWANSTLPPDVILEVGPPPCGTRYAVHGALIAMHSGYLRAALRTFDHNSHPGSASESLRRVLQHPSTIGTGSALLGSAPNEGHNLLYLPNVTPEQFTPLLTYMYTGYLDLTLDNIFGVLLATHLLHMPRALELCRAFLSSSSSSATAASHTAPPIVAHPNANYYAPQTPLAASSATIVPKTLERPRLVRPIASKAMATMGLHFIAPPTASQINLLPSTPFRSLVVGPPLSMAATAGQDTQSDLRTQHEYEDELSSQSPISVTKYEDDTVTYQSESHANDASRCSAGKQQSNSEVTVDIEGDDRPPKPAPQDTSIPRASPPASSASRKHSSTVGHHVPKTAAAKGKQETTPSMKRHKSANPAPEVASDSASGTGVIIDIASCDGPVRFRRVLNVMYGCNRNNKANGSTSGSNSEDGLSDGSVKKTVNPRAMPYATSFHQQMARNINDTGKLLDESSSSSSFGSVYHNHPQGQTGKLKQCTPPVAAHQQNLEQELQKDENSEEVPGMSCKTDTPAGGFYTCVYCKHSFKSHFCYQKHAKRHIIPMRLVNSQATESGASVAKTDIKESTSLESVGAGSVHSRTFEGRRHVPHPSSSSSNRREASKPLDMNVQYYPCKTCGSKFPSYYFVHKHRKLCHTEEDDEPSNAASNEESETNTKRHFDDSLPQNASNAETHFDISANPEPVV